MFTISPDDPISKKSENDISEYENMLAEFNQLSQQDGVPDKKKAPKKRGGGNASVPKDGKEDMEVPSMGKSVNSFCMKVYLPAGYEVKIRLARAALKKEFSRRLREEVVTFVDGLLEESMSVIMEEIKVLRAEKGFMEE